MITLAGEPDNGEGHRGGVTGERRTADPPTLTEGYKIRDDEVYRQILSRPTDSLRK